MKEFYLVILVFLILLAILPGQVIQHFPSFRQRVDLNSALQIPRFRISLVIVTILGSILIAIGSISLHAELYLALNFISVLAHPHEWWGGPTYGPQLSNIGISYEDWANARRQPYQYILPIAKQEVIARVILGENRENTCFTENIEACSLVTRFGSVHRAMFFKSFLIAFLTYFFVLLTITLACDRLFFNKGAKRFR